MLDEYMLTTIDNPYDPFEQFDSWLLFDVEKGYNTCAHLDRVSHTSDDMSEEEVAAEIDRAMNEIIKYDFQNIYKKVQRKTSREDVKAVDNA
jgi:hypothetical protein